MQKLQTAGYLTHQCWSETVFRNKWKKKATWEPKEKADTAVPVLSQVLVLKFQINRLKNLREFWQMEYEGIFQAHLVQTQNNPILFLFCKIESLRH